MVPQPIRVEEKAARRAILVMGTARSGTSALTRVLNLLGVELGAELKPAKPGSNEKGFFEHVEIHRHHVELFAATGAEWDELVERPPRWWDAPAAAPIRASLRAAIEREFAAAPLWGFKDPELCLLFPLWEEMLRELGVEPLPVLIVRHPSESAASFARLRREGEQLAHLVWLRTVVAAERATRDGRRAITTYEEMLRDWRGAVARIGDALGLRWPRAPDARAAAIEEFLDPALRHHRAPDGPPESRIEEMARSLHAAFVSAARGDESGLPAAVAAAEEEISTALPLLAPIAAELREGAARSRCLEEERSAARAEAAAARAETGAARAEAQAARGEAARMAGKAEALSRELDREKVRLLAARKSAARGRRLRRRMRRRLLVRLWAAWRALLRRLRRLRRRLRGDPRRATSE